LPDTVDLATPRAWPGLSELDPAIVGLGLARLGAEQHNAVRLALEDPDAIREVAHVAKGSTNPKGSTK
jgi:hypothetical protein